MTAKTLYITDMPPDVGTNPMEHNYIRLIEHYVPKDLMKSGVYMIHTAHDDWCAIYKKGNCDCRPEITIEKAQTHEVVFTIRWKTGR